MTGSSLPPPFHARGLLVLAIAALVPLAGCVSVITGDDDGGPLSTSSYSATVPDVKPTGRTREFNLYLHNTMIHAAPNVMLMGWGFSFSDQGPGLIPGPEIRVTEGDLVRITFYNTHNFDHTIHWHGVHVPWEMDGIPYVSQEPIRPGESFTYEFIAKPSGTFFYHCHVDSAHHIDMGMYGAFIIEPQDKGRDPPFDRDATLILDEWDTKHLHGTNPNMTMHTIPKSGDPQDYETWARRQVRDAVDQNPLVYPANPLREQRDWYPETYPAYDPEYDAFLINGKAFPDTEPIFLKEGERLRVRMVNAGFAWHAMHVHGHAMLNTHKDGYLLQSPVLGDTFSIAPGERLDFLLEGTNPGVWMLHDHNQLNEMNHHISPGGISTMIVYDAFKDKAAHGGHAAHGGDDATVAKLVSKRSGDYLRWYLR